ncbi:uncharacterized protein UTRI_03661 [Ustilago trichophora]|uniref:Uncharacterized protein n=1 Tax=Ustilago trichophora TaxID=86804 RepID=A0A5C3E104_9BASI|nr:uncharacterized protein UTRI_03661 [Ustilago trichophora]
MDVSVAQVAIGSPRHCGDAAAFTPDLQHSRYMSGESDDDSAHATPSDMTIAMAQTSPRESWPTTKRVGEEEVRKIHYIDSPAQNPVATISALSAPPAERSTIVTVPVAAAPAPAPAPAPTGASSAPLASSQATIPSTTSMAPTTTAPHATVATAPAAASSSASASSSTPPSTSTMTSAPTQMASSGLPSLGISSKGPEAIVDTASADPLPSHLASTAPSSAASTPASTPGAAPQTYARKRGRPRKHPLPDPNNMPPKAKRKLSADSAATAGKKKASAAAAARSAASSAGSLLSVPDLGRLIPQGSSSENAQTFIQNNLRLFADLFVALQKQASTDHNVRDEANAELKGIAEVSIDQPQLATQQEPFAPAANATTNSGDVDPSSQADASITADASDASTKGSGPSDPIRDEIKKKMADVIKGREAIQAEMLQMRVDASFFENAQKTVDERILILRERIAKNTVLLQREREATRKAREASRIAKKDRKAREKGLRDSEREERRLAHTFMQLEREIAAQEEERRRLEEAESSDEEDEHASGGEYGTLAQDRGSIGILDQLQDFNTATLDASPSETTSMSATATPSVHHDTPAATDRAIGFSDEELAKVLGISTSELAGFSQTLEFTSLQPPSASVSTSDADPASTLVSILSPGQSIEPLTGDAPGATTDSFDVAAFLEMASSFGAVAPSGPSIEQQDGHSLGQNAL